MISIHLGRIDVDATALPTGFSNQNGRAVLEPYGRWHEEDSSGKPAMVLRCDPDLSNIGERELPSSAVRVSQPLLLFLCGHACDLERRQEHSCLS